MVIIRKQPLTENLSIGELAKIDSKTNMLETFQIIGVSVAKSWDKTTLANGMNEVFEKDTALFTNKLPKDELMFLAGLLECKQEECVPCPIRDDEFLMLQRLHLVVTYEDKKVWLLYMPDKIRNRLNDMFNEHVKLYPEIDEMNQILSKIGEKRDRLYRLLDENNPDTLTKAKATIQRKLEGVNDFL